MRHDLRSRLYTLSLILSSCISFLCCGRGSACILPVSTASFSGSYELVICDIEVAGQLSPIQEPLRYLHYSSTTGRLTMISASWSNAILYDRVPVSYSQHDLTTRDKDAVDALVASLLRNKSVLVNPTGVSLDGNNTHPGLEVVKVLIRWPSGKQTFNPVLSIKRPCYDDFSTVLVYNTSQTQPADLQGDGPPTSLIAPNSPIRALPASAPARHCFLQDNPELLKVMHSIGETPLPVRTLEALSLNEKKWASYYPNGTRVCAWLQTPTVSFAQMYCIENWLMEKDPGYLTGVPVQRDRIREALENTWSLERNTESAH